MEFGKKTYIMGILNVTPDSFSDGGDFNSNKSALEHAKRMIEEGADIIDIGGESTRPGSSKVGKDEEYKRVIPVVETLVKEIEGVYISVDTYKAAIADVALERGAKMINDVWGLQKDPEMASVIARHSVPVVMMHNQDGTDYQNDIMESIIDFFKESIRLAKEAGVENHNLILDPGIGFGKTADQNLEVIDRLEELQVLGYPVLLGTSRKSMIGKILDLPPKERVEGTIATNIIGVTKGVDIIRVHDIKENIRAVKVADAIVRGV